MFQCIIQQRNGWIHAPSPEMRDVFPDIRLQLNEQLRCLDVRMESQVSLIQELQDFFRRRGEVELDYSKSLDKLAKSLQLRHKEQKQKREQWPMFSSYACWQQLVNQTKSLSKDHAALSEIYSTHLVARLQTVIEDVQRIYKKCREIGYETHEEILRVLQELHTTMKTYHSYQSECKAAEAKLRTAENQRAKLQLTNPKEKLERSKKYRLIEKEMLKRKSKYSDARLKALKAKNEYQLCLEASNTTIHKYFVEDLSDLIDCMDLGFHSMVSRALLMHVTADQGRCRAVLHNSDTLSHTVHSMDSRADKQKFLELYHGAFMIPKRLEFQGQLQEPQPVEPDLQKALHSEMEARLQHLGQRVGNLRTESEEIWKTLETAELSLLEILNIKDYDSSSHFGDSTTQSAKPESLTIKLRADKQEIEEFYITKIREYILGTSRIARLDSKAELLRTALAKDSALQCNNTLLVKSNVPKRKRIGRMNMTGQPKLFGGSLEEYLETTNEEIPLIMRSCIRVINLFGLHHQGIFRVSGSQVEISNFREGFERGEDPLADTTDASDINSVAGVLKLYLRELREPLFPIIYFDHFVTLAQIESKHELVCGIRKFLQSLSRPVIIVIRYIFAFLNHLSEYSDENMMDAYNLAICFGPTLMPAPEDKDQVQYQNQVNELIKSMIVYHEELFPKDLGGIIYEKYISPNDPLDEIEESPTEQLPEDPDSEVCPSEDESDTMMEGTVQFDFIARSNRELSLRKGDHVILRKQVSNDWWQGTVKGKDGLIPDKYISVKIKGEDRDKSSDHLKSSSSEESVRKRRPSGNLIVNNQQLSIYTNVGSQSQSQSTDDGLSTSTVVAASASSSSSSQNPSISSTVTVVTPPVHDSANILLLKQQTLNDLSTPTTTTTTTGGDRKQSSAPVNIIPNQKQQQQSLITDQYDDDCVDHNVNVKSKYNYHDEPHSFENSMEFLEDFNHFQYENKKVTEPIYAEPSKVPQLQQKKVSSSAAVSSSSSASTSIPLSTSACSSSSGVGQKNSNDIQNLHFNEYEGVALRNPKSIITNTITKIIELPVDYSSNRKSDTITTTAAASNKIENNYSNILGLIKPTDNLPDGSKNIILLSRHSDSEVFKDQQQQQQKQHQLINDRQTAIINKDIITTTDSGVVDSIRQPSTRKFHSKSFSLSENRIASNFTNSICGGGGGAGGGVSTIDYDDGGSTTNLFQQNRKLWEKRTVELNQQQQQQQQQQQHHQQQQQSHYLSTPRILTRNRIAPDLVMDLPFPVKEKLKSHNSQDSLDADGDTDDDSVNGNGNNRSTMMDDMNDSGAERFATQHQCTLKKNERYSNGSVGGGNNNNDILTTTAATGPSTTTVTSTTVTPTTSTTTSSTIPIDGYHEKKEVKLDYKDLENNKPKAKVKPQEINKDNSIHSGKKLDESATIINENILHIQESHDHHNTDDGNQLTIDNCSGNNNNNINSSSSSSIATTGAGSLKELHKSPIPLRNTQKFVSKFADLHLTGGCLNVPLESSSSSSTSTTTTTTTAGIIGSSSSGSMNNICQTITLSSFKPQVKVKPQLMKKPLVLPVPTTPEMIRRQHPE